MAHFSQDRGYGRWLSRYLAFVSRYKGFILLLYLFVMGFFTYQSFHIQLDSNLYTLFPQNMKSLKHLQKMQSYYGGAGSLTLSVKVPHPDQMLSALLPKYVDENRQNYIRDLESLEKSPQNLFTPEELENVEADLTEYFYKMDHYYLPAFRQELKGGSDKKYTELFLREYQEIIYPDISEKAQNFRKKPDKPNLRALLEAFRDNVSGAKLYLSKIAETLPLHRQRTLEDFARRFARALSKDSTIIFVDYVFNQKFVEDHLLYFLDLSDTRYIQDQMQGRIDYERRKSLLSSFLFMDTNDSDLQLKFLRDKYIRSRGTGVSRKFIRLQNPDEVLDGTGSGEVNQFFFSDTKDTVVLNLRLSRGAIDINYSLKVLDLVDQVFARVKKQNSEFHDLFLVPSGQYLDRKEDARVLRADIARVTPISFFLVCLVIVIYFRSLLAVLVVCFPLLSGMLSALGFVSFTYGYLNLVSSFLVAIISGLGVNLGTHLLARYLEAKHRGKTPQEALYEIFTTIFLSNITATITTAAGFFILALSSFKGFREFGIIAGIGMVSLLIGIILTFPTLILWLESHNLFRIRLRQKKSFAHLRSRPFPMFKFWCVLGVIFVLFSLASVKNIHFNANFTSLMRKSDALPTLFDYYGTSAQQILKLSNTSGVIPIYTPSRKIYEELTEKFLTGRFSNENFRIESLYVYDPKDQAEKQVAMRSLRKTLQSGLLNANDDPEIQKKIDFLKRIVRTPQVNWGEIPTSLREPFLGIKPGYFLLYYAMESPKSVSIINHYYNDFEQIDREYGDRGVFLASDIWIFGDLIRELQKESLLLFLGIFITFVCLLWLDFHSILLVTVALVPLVVGFIGIVGFSILFGVEWNFFNVLMFPVIAGLGIDYGVHMIHRIREEGDNNLWFVFCTTGVTMWIAALEDIIGFGVLIIALYYGLTTTGELLMIGVLSCLLSGSLLLPSIAQWRKDIMDRGLKASLSSWDGFLPQSLVRKLSSKKTKPTSSEDGH